MEQKILRHKRLLLQAVKNRTRINDCSLCVLSRTECDDFCLLAGHHYYIRTIKKMPLFQYIKGRIINYFKTLKNKFRHV